MTTTTTPTERRRRIGGAKPKPDTDPAAQGGSATTREPAPKRSEPKDAEPRAATRNGAVPKQGTRKGAAPRRRPLPKGAVPRQAEPAGAAAKTAAPGTTAPKQAQTGRTATRPLAPGRTAPKPAPKSESSAVREAADTERYSAPPRAPFVLLIVGLLAGALVGLLLLNTVLAQDAFSLSELQRNNQQLEQRKQALQEAIYREESPSVLAQEAKALGMVPIVNPAYIDRKTGRVIQTGAAHQSGISNTAVNALGAAGVAGVAGPVVVVPGNPPTTADGRSTGGHR